MEHHGNDSKQHNLWYAAALLAPVIHSASALPWLAALVLAAAAMILGRLSCWGQGWVLAAQKIWAGIMTGVFMKWSAFYWEGLPFGNLTPLLLLALAVWTVSAKEKGARVACVLLWPLVFLVTSVLVSGVSQIQMTHLKPVWKLPNLALLAVLLIPNKAGTAKNWKMATAAVAVGLITTGVLSTKVSASVNSGIYELSRSLSLLGIAERFESVVAAAMTLGFYCSIAYLLEGGEQRFTWGGAAIAAITYGTGVPIQGWFMTIGSIGAWVILPGFNVQKIIAKKGKKGIDKTGSA